MTMRVISALAMASLAGTTAAQDSNSLRVPPYCSDLKQVVDLAAGNAGFRSITGSPRQGNYLETKLALAGWNDCLLYGAGTYTCDSQVFKGAGEAQYAQVGIFREIQACLGSAWREVKERSSPSYVVLHNTIRPVSITLSTDETDQRDHIVRLTIFIRRN
jgi:hypothetical protein